MEAVALSEFERRLEAIEPPKPVRAEPGLLPALAWLALAPAWPETLARHGFPVGESRISEAETVSDFLRQLEKVGRVRSGPGEFPLEGTWFWFDSHQRAAACDDILQSPSHGLAFLQNQLVEAATAMKKAAQEQPVNPSFERWIRLGTAGSPAQIAKLIDDEVAEALQAAVSAEAMSCPAALRWLEIAQPLAGLLGGQIEVAVARAQRRIEQFRRNARDRRQLEKYYPRPELEQSVRDLLTDAADESWALHCVGMGGTGKTMLVQWIRTALAPVAGLAVGHIDFDSLNPDYPRRAPGLLLMGFVEDLRLDEDPQVARTFQEFDFSIGELHKKLQIVSAPALATETPEFQTACDHFCSALTAICRKGRRPVLILDTCEELARVRSDGVLPDTINFTFGLLQRIHDNVVFEGKKPVRVIFSGRRALARSGFGWSWPDSPLPPLPYLRLAQVQPFDLQEAQGFLRKYSSEKRTVPEQSCEDVLELCRVQAGSYGDDNTHILWDDGHASRRRENIYYPYDLDMLAGWACSPQGLDFEKLRASGMHFYIKERVVDRIDMRLRPFLPDLALLGRFDRPMLESLTGYSGKTLENFWDYTTSLEWIQPERNAQTDQVWAANPFYRDRLLAYYRDESEAATQLAVARNRTWELLRDITLQRPFAKLTPEYFVACLAVAPRDGRSAAIWWEQVEGRIAAAAEWDWGRQLTEAVSADENAMGGINDAGFKWSLKAAILATAAAVNTHLTPERNRLIWSEILAALPLYPTEQGRERLKQRGNAGAIVVWLVEPPVPTVDEVLARARDLMRICSDNQGFASMVAVFESIVEFAEVRPDETERRTAASALLDLLPAVPPDAAAELRAFFQSLRGRLLMLSGMSLEVADAALRQGLEIAPPGELRQSWLDWRIPDDLVMRLRLEQARIVRPRLIPAGPVTIDAERLRSAGLLAQLQSGVASVVEADLAITDFVPTCNAHRAFPPLFALAIEAKAALGDFDGAIRHARAISADSKLRLDVRQAADRALLTFALPMLLFEEKIGLDTSLAYSDLRSDRISMAVLAVLRAPDGDAAQIKTLMESVAESLAARQQGPRGRAQALFLQALLATKYDGAGSLGLFDEAHRGFDEAGDKRGAVYSGIARMTQDLLLNADAGRLRANASDVLRLIGDLPPANATPTLGGSGQDWTNFLEVLPVGWRPWMTRLAACAIRSQEFATAGDRSRHLSDWLAKSYDSDTAAEIRKILAPPRHDFTYLKRVRSAAIDIFAGTAVAAGFVWGVVALYIGFTWCLSLFGLGLDTFWNVVAFVAVLFALGVLVANFPGLLKVYVRFCSRIIDLETTLTPTGNSKDMNDPLATPCEVSLRMRGRISRFLPIPTVSKMQITRAVSYSETYLRQSKAFPPLAAWVRLANSFFRRFAVLNSEELSALSSLKYVIRLDEAGAAAPWEAVASMRSLDEILIGDASRLRFWRAPKHLAIAAESPFPESARSMTWYMDTSAVRFAPAAWSSAAIPHALEVPQISSGSIQRDSRTVVLHIVGKAVETAAGLCLRLTAADTGGRSELRADQIAAAFSAMRLCIIQGFPEEIDERTSADRYAANVARRFGLQLQTAGVPAVLLLPPMPTYLASEVIGRLVRDIYSGKLDAARLADIARNIRGVIARQVHPDVESATEIAFDVCVYVLDEFKLDLTQIDRTAASAVAFVKT